MVSKGVYTAIAVIREGKGQKEGKGEIAEKGGKRLYGAREVGWRWLPLAPRYTVYTKACVWCSGVWGEGVDDCDKNQ